ncbi:MAG: hypothetical protein AAF543_14640 [Pseudomonadota bacterium]
MPDFLFKLGFIALVGLILGVALAIWANPETDHGFIFIVLMVLVPALALEKLVQWWQSRKAGE